MGISMLINNNDGGTDFNKMLPVATSGSNSQSTEATLISITGKGILMGITAYLSTNGLARYKIVIDGVTLMPLTTLYAYSPTNGNGASVATPMLPFNNSLVITHTTGNSGLTLTSTVFYDLA